MALITKEQAADRIAALLSSGEASFTDVFGGFSSSRISAILQYGADKTEFIQMTARLNLLLSQRKAVSA